jgi:VanZ family protein
MRFLVLIFIALIVYGSLFPFGGWVAPDAPLFRFLVSWPQVVEKADLVQNVLAYLPLGLFLVVLLMRSMRFRTAIVSATLAGAALSLAMECIQQFVPGRTPSPVDLMLNTLGTCAGGLCAVFLTAESFSGARLATIRNRWLRAGALPNIALVTLGLWALSQTSPLVPTFDMGQLRHGLSLIFRTLHSPANLNLSQAASYALFIASLGLLSLAVARHRDAMLRLFLLFIACVLALKIIIEGRQLSLEAVIGAVCAGLLLLLLRPAKARAAIGILGIAFIAAGFTVSELASVPSSGSNAFNWTPFGGQMESLNGFQNILDIVWPFFAMAFFARYMTPYHRRDAVALFGGMIILGALFALEWWQQYLPGRYGDITQVALGLAGWIVPWCAKSADYANDDAGAVKHAKAQGRRR